MKMNFDENDFLTVKDIQTILHMSKTTVYKLLHQDDFPTLQLGGHILIPRVDFEKFINNYMGKKYIF